MKAATAALALLALFVLPTRLLAAPGKDAAKLDRCLATAQTCSAALLAEDYDKFVACTYPKLVELAGGPAGLTKLLRSGRADMRKQGFELLTTKMERPRELIAAGKLTLAMVPQTLTLAAPGGKLIKKGYLLGVSRDGGRSWQFLDGEGLTDENVKTFIPGFPSRVKLPARQEAVFESADGAGR